MAGGVVLDEVDLPAIEPGESVVVGPLEIDTLGWMDPTAPLTVMVDFEDLVEECDESNNALSDLGLGLANACD